MKIKITKGFLESTLDEWGDPIIQLTVEGDGDLLSDERKELMSKIVEYLESKEPEFEIKEVD